MTVNGINNRTQETMTSEGEKSCIHCGSVVIGRADEFCCRGCEVVFKTIHALGLEGFYSLREVADRINNEQLNPDKNYSYLDDRELSAGLVTSETNGNSRIQFYLPTIHCAACVWILERLPQVIRGVRKSRVSFGQGTIDVEFDPLQISLSKLAQTLNSIGYPPVPATQGASAEQDKREDRAMLKRIGVAAVAAANTMMMADLLAQGASSGMEEQYKLLMIWLSAIITLPALIYSAAPFYRAAIGSFITGRVHIDIPVSLAILAAYINGLFHALRNDPYVYFDSITCLILLLLVARYVQRRALHKARGSSATSWDLFPAKVRVIVNNESCEKPFRELTIGDVVEVRPGERIPSDGKVLSGLSTVESAFLTGESMPASVKAEDQVLGGSLNVDGTLRIEIESVGPNSRLGRILSDLNSSRSEKSEIESKIDNATERFTGFVVLLAALAYLVWLKIDPARAADIAISLLVVTCPCALGLAIPAAISVALARAQKRNFYIKNSRALKTLANAEHFYFDKTGTLTEGRLVVQEYLGDPANAHLAAAIAARSSAHPVALAIASAFPQDSSRISAVKSIPAKGIEASTDSGLVFLGSTKWSFERGVRMPDSLKAKFEAWSEESVSICLLDNSSEVLAIFKLEDSLRTEARPFIQDLHRGGKKTFILSGDSKSVVSRAAKSLGIPEQQALGELYPEQKAAVLENDSAITVMIGDGLNDSLAMHKSNLGIGLSGGIEATFECADIFVLNGGLKGFEELYKGAITTYGIIKRNVFYSVIYNLAGAALALSGHLTPLIAAIIMPLSSLTVIVSSVITKSFSRE